LSINLNIITINIPYPPDYGGMIDTFYRIKALHIMGVKIHLHCFEYGRNQATELESLCASVYYYPRRSGLFQNFTKIPYVVYSRRSKELLKNLLKNDYPVLFDGLHTTIYLNHPALAGRKKLVRLHNIEHKYYHSLSVYEANLLKKLYFRLESFKLKRYEKVLGGADYIFSISTIEHDYFENRYHNSVYLAPFHPYNDCGCQPGIGDYILYHGDLSVNENVAMAEKLIENVFSKISYPCIIAGKNPPGKMLKMATAHTNIKVVPNPEELEMTALISNAHINLLPALASNGFKIKLLFAFFGGRYCIVNSVFAESTDIGSLCHTADSNKDTIQLINSLMTEPFTENLIKVRKRELSDKWDNLSNGKKLADYID